MQVPIRTKKKVLLRTHMITHVTSLWIQLSLLREWNWM